MNLRLLSLASACTVGLVGCGDGDQAKRSTEAPPAVAGVPRRLPTEPHEVPAGPVKAVARPTAKPEVKRSVPIDYYRIDTSFNTAPKFDPNGRFFFGPWKDVSGKADVYDPTVMHSQSVRSFVNRSGMGVGRDLPMGPPEVVTELLYGGEIEQADPKPTGKPRPVYESRTATMTLPDGMKCTVREVEWQVRSRLLVSVESGDGPAVYLPEPVTVHNNKSKKIATSENTPKRKLDEFETEALERLRKGEDLAVQSTSETVRMLGAIRSTDNCSRCHKVPDGTLLGAFSYEMHAKPEAAEKLNPGK